MLNALTFGEPYLHLKTRLNISSTLVTLDAGSDATAISYLG